MRGQPDSRGPCMRLRSSRWSDRPNLEPLRVQRPVPCLLEPPQVTLVLLAKQRYLVTSDPSLWLVTVPEHHAVNPAGLVILAALVDGTHGSGAHHVPHLQVVSLSPVHQLPAVRRGRHDLLLDIRARGHPPPGTDVPRPLRH